MKEFKQCFIFLFLLNSKSLRFLTYILLNIRSYIFNCFLRILDSIKMKFDHIKFGHIKFDIIANHVKNFKLIFNSFVKTGNKFQTHLWFW